MLFAWGTAANAEPAQADPADPPAQALETSAGTADVSEGWEFATITYVWLASAKGDIDVIGPPAPVELDLSIGDTLGALKFAFMGAAEARHDRLVLLGDLMFVHLGASDDIKIREADLLEAELDSRTVAITALGGYRVANKGPTTVDIMAGARLNIVENELQLTGPIRSFDGEVSETWFDPVVAVRTHVPLGSDFGLALYGDIGGFGLGSDLTWQGVASVQYRLSRKFTLSAGWRYFKVNYDKGVFLYDVAQSGPLFGLRFDF